MTPEQREKKNRWLREWRKTKRKTDPEWRKYQIEYSKAYEQSRRNDGSDFFEKKRKVKNAYYHRLTATEKGRQKVQEQALRSYQRMVQDPERKAILRQKERDRASKRRKSDPLFALKGHLRARLSDLVRNGKCTKNKSAIRLTGVTLSELREHLEKQFKRGMSWNNYGKWHIDHIIPCSAFDLLDPRQLAVCFNYLNLRPCWAQENIRKGASIFADTQMPLGL